MGRLGTVLAAAAVAAVLGTAGGVLSAVSTQADGRARDPQVSPPPDAAHDPLRLGVRLANLPTCDKSTVVLLGWGSTQTQLQRFVQDNADAHYLEPAQSCATAYPKPNGSLPEYAVYLGPFSTPQEACEVRMGQALRGSYATVLNAGNHAPVICACYLGKDDLLDIGQGATKTVSTGMYTKMYQRMLVDAGLMPKGSDTGQFDRATVDVTRTLQTDNGLNPDAIVGPDIWAIVQGEACDLYDYGR